MQPVEWPPQKGTRIAGVNSFGITGTDAHAVVEEAPSHRYARLQDLVTVDGLKERKIHILTTSGKDQESLKKNVKHLQTFIKSKRER